MAPDNLYLGTVSWVKRDWIGSFYPPRCKAAELLPVYARTFHAVEIDATYYRIPSTSVVTGWRDRTPPGFVFAAKVPRVVTAIKRLRDAERDLTRFLAVMERLGDKLGPFLLQFPQFNSAAFASREPFDRLLRPFLASLPASFRFAVEIRNREWIDSDFLDLLREHRAALVFLAQPWMPSIEALRGMPDCITGDFCYVRFMGDRQTLESKTDRFDRLVEDKTAEMALWARELRPIARRGLRTYVFFSNYYAGYGPGSAQAFAELWQRI
jgi:uncharacterized protein YecE (DUF72 family)